MATHSRLRNLGLEKLDILAKFVEDFEKLRFSSEEVQRLARLKQGLERIHVNSEDVQSKLDLLDKLEKNITNLQRARDDIEEQVPRMIVARQILERYSVEIPCYACGRPMAMPLMTKEEFNSLVMQRASIPVTCQSCGAPQPLDPRDIVAALGFSLLPSWQ